VSAAETQEQKATASSNVFYSWLYLNVRSPEPEIEVCVCVCVSDLIRILLYWSVSKRWRLRGFTAYVFWMPSDTVGCHSVEQHGITLQQGWNMSNTALLRVGLVVRNNSVVREKGKLLHWQNMVLYASIRYNRPHQLLFGQHEKASHSVQRGVKSDPLTNSLQRSHTDSSNYKKVSFNTQQTIFQHFNLRQGGHVFVAVCLCAKYLKSYERILTIFSRKNAYVLVTNRLAFGEDCDSLADHGSFYTILYH